MTNLAEAALSVLNSPPVVRPQKLLKSLPDIVRRILPHARYSSFFETLVAGSHPQASDASARKTPSLPNQDDIASEHLPKRSNTGPLRKGICGAGGEPLTSRPYPDNLVFRNLYKAHGKFAWMNGQKIEDVRVLMWLGEGIMSSAYIKSGNVRSPRQDGRETTSFNYVCKTWDTTKMGQWDGFYSELALYKSSRYLLPLQGDVVPYVMGVYTRPGKIDIAMELPHPVFWMEASASMPVVLKDCVVEAFRKLHERGIVHGDVALRHILIGADARVTLIDFQASRADEPNEELDLAMTYPGEKDLEIRRVKFLLNMDNARKKEFKRSKAALKRSERNKRREQRRRELLRHGITTGLPLDEPEPLEDINKPPVPLDELERYWMEDANDDPRRFIVPGTSETEVAEAISSFLRCIKGMEGADCDWSIVCNAPSSPRSPLASPSLSPRNDNASITELPSSIKVRDFAYESAYWSPIPRPQEELGTRNHATSPLSVEKGKISGDRAIVLSDSKRHREDDEERCACVEGLPTGKTPRPDDCQSLISRPQEELGTRNHDPPSPLSVEKRNISDDRAIILSHSPTHLKRHREEDEERAAYVEGLPTGKRPRADDCRSVVSRPQEELGTRNHGPPSPLSVEKRNISGDRAIILSHPPTHLKRHREDEEERAPYVEGLPAGKRPRPDDCRSPISCPEEERGTRNHDPSSPLSVERGSIPGDSTVVSPTHMKRHRKDEEENAACVEGLPTGKKLRLDDSSSKECDLAVIAVTDIHSES